MNNDNSPFVTYKRVQDRSHAFAIAEALKEAGIESQLQQDLANASIASLGGQGNGGYIIKLKSTDFDKANEYLEQNVSDDIDNVDEDHYLFGFSDEELMEVLSRPDEWSEYDYLLAKKILGQRGRTVDDDVLNTLKNLRINELSRMEEASDSWIVAGYVLAVLGGLLGIFIGHYLYYSKKTRPDGSQIYAFPKRFRKHGKRIMWVGVAFQILWIGFYLLIK